MSETSTRTATQTSTQSKVVYVTRKVQTDLLEIADTYGVFSLSYAQKVIHDVRVLLDEELVDWVQFVWTSPGSNFVLGAIQYAVVVGGYGLVDDHAGGIRYQSELAKADFHVRVNYTSRWQALSETERSALAGELSLTWGPAGQLDYGGGKWVADKTYSMEGYGLPRSRFER